MSNHPAFSDMVSELFKPNPIPWSKWCTGVFALVGMFVLLALRHDEDSHPRARVFPSSITFDQGPYRIPDGCIPRTWSVGEYLPEGCVNSYAFRGLADARHGRRARGSFFKPRHLLWVRVNADALLIARASPDRGGMVVQVERGRFRPTRLPVFDMAADPAPLNYWFFYTLAFVLHGGLMALLGVALWARRPWQTPTAITNAEPVAA